MKTNKEKGDIGVTASIYEFTKNGYNVSLPIAEHLKYDIVVEKDGEIARVQCRYASSRDENDFVSVRLSSIWSNRKGNVRRDRNVGDYDIISVYCPNTDKCYFLSDSEFDAKTNINISFKDEKESDSIRLASDIIDCNRAFGIWLTYKKNQGNESSFKKEALSDLLGKDKLLELKKTMTNQQIGILYNTSHISIANLVRQYNIGEDVNEVIRLKRNKNYLLWREQVMNLYLKKKSARSISKQVGCSRYMVIRIIDEEILKKQKA